MPHKDPDVRRAYARTRYAANPEKVRAQKRASAALRYAANPGKQAATMRRCTHGTDGLDLFDAQAGRCAICSTDLLTLAPKHRHLDHCHATKKVRGWLCQVCNMSLGLMQDNPERLRSAVSYLEKHSA